MNLAASLIKNKDLYLNDYESIIGRFKSTFRNNDATFTANQKLRNIIQRWLGDITNLTKY